MPDLSPKQIGAIRDLLNRLCPNLGLAFSEQLNRETVISVLDLREVPLSELLTRNYEALQTQFTLTEPQGLESVLVIAQEDAAALAALLDGSSPEEQEAASAEAVADTLSPAMNGLVNGFAAGLTMTTGNGYEVETSSTHLSALTIPPVFALEGSGLEARFSLSIPGTLTTEISALFTGSLLVELLPSESPEPAPGISLAGSIPSEDDVAAMLSQVTAASGGYETAPVQSPPLPSGPEFRAGTPASGQSSDLSMPRGLDMILDIPLDVTVELGRVRMLIKDVLELSSGSIIELERVAGEPVDLLVNGRLVAKGEVVVIEDNFGIRITEITSPAERVAGLGKGR